MSHKIIFLLTFILFANATTYETEDATETLLDTSSGGKGYYCTGGRYVSIRWVIDQSGEIVFLNEANEVLTVNRGTSYISFVKASAKDSVSIS